MLPDVLSLSFFFPFPPSSSEIFSSAFLAERILLLGVMVLLWIQVQNKMEDEGSAAPLQSKQRTIPHVEDTQKKKKEKRLLLAN